MFLVGMHFSLGKSHGATNYHCMIIALFGTQGPEGGGMFKIGWYDRRNACLVK